LFQGNVDFYSSLIPRCTMLASRASCSLRLEFHSFCVSIERSDSEIVVRTFRRVKASEIKSSIRLPNRLRAALLLAVPTLLAELPPEKKSSNRAEPPDPLRESTRRLPVVKLPNGVREKRWKSALVPES